MCLSLPLHFKCHFYPWVNVHNTKPWSSFSFGSVSYKELKLIEENILIAISYLRQFNSKVIWQATYKYLLKTYQSVNCQNVHVTQQYLLPETAVTDISRHISLLNSTWKHAFNKVWTSYLLIHMVLQSGLTEGAHRFHFLSCRHHAGRRIHKEHSGNLTNCTIWTISPEIHLKNVKELRESMLWPWFLFFPRILQILKFINWCIF